MNGPLWHLHGVRGCCPSSAVLVSPRCFCVRSPIIGIWG